jgi:hypothetical protein
MDGDEIRELLVGMEPAATKPEDEDHTTFWLVVADQLHRRGIATQASTRALEIISEGTNLDVLRELGMSDSDLKKRSGKLKELGAKLSGPLPSKTRRTLKSPQTIPVQPGEVYSSRSTPRRTPTTRTSPIPPRRGLNPSGGAAVWWSRPVMRSTTSPGFS